MANIPVILIYKNLSNSILNAFQNIDFAKEILSCYHANLVPGSKRKSKIIVPWQGILASQPPKKDISRKPTPKFCNKVIHPPSLTVHSPEKSQKLQLNWQKTAHEKF